MKAAKSPKRCKIKPRLLLRTNTRFRLVPNSVTLDDLERQKRYSCRNEIALRSPRENLNEYKSIPLAVKCRPMILVSNNIKYTRIFVWVL